MSRGHDRIKGAVRRMLMKLGGSRNAASVTRVSHVSLHRYAEVGEADCHIPADVISDLECEFGEPLITQALALQAGFALVPLPNLGAERGRTEIEPLVREAVADLASTLNKQRRPGNAALSAELQAVIQLLHELDAACGGAAESEAA